MDHCVQWEVSPLPNNHVKNSWLKFDSLGVVLLCQSSFYCHNTCERYNFLESPEHLGDHSPVWFCGSGTLCAVALSLCTA